MLITVITSSTSPTLRVASSGVLADIEGLDEWLGTRR